MTTSQMKRMEILSSKYEGGHLLVTVRGQQGERFEDLVWQEPHGFHSRPHAGAIGHMMIPGGRADMAFVMAASDPKKLPQLEEGESAMYDAGSNVVKLTAGGWQFNMDVVITGNVTITGNVALDGNLDATGVVTDGDGNNSA